MSQDTDFVATGPSSVGFRTGPGQPLNIETSGLFEGKNVGVEGKADLGAGVSGNSVSDDGVVGTTSTVGKSGVFGFNTQSNGAAFGVSGSSGSPDGAGVNGFSDPGVGVRGTSKANDGVVGSSSVAGKSGVFGFNTQSNGAAFGVSGSSGSPDGAGVNGFSGKGYGGNFQRGARLDAPYTCEYFWTSYYRESSKRRVLR